MLCWGVGKWSTRQGTALKMGFSAPSGLAAQCWVRRTDFTSVGPYHFISQNVKTLEGSCEDILVCPRENICTSMFGSQNPGARPHISELNKASPEGRLILSHFLCGRDSRILRLIWIFIFLKIPQSHQKITVSIEM